MPSVFNNDDLLRQIRKTTTGMDKAFKLENIKLDLGKIKDETGQESAVMLIWTIWLRPKNSTRLRNLSASSSSI